MIGTFTQRGGEDAGAVEEAGGVEIDNWAAETLRQNRGTEGPLGKWKVHEMDVHDLDGRPCCKQSF